MRHCCTGIEQELQLLGLHASQRIGHHTRSGPLFERSFVPDHWISLHIHFESIDVLVVHFFYRSSLASHFNWLVVPFLVISTRQPVAEVEAEQLVTFNEDLRAILVITIVPGVDALVALDPFQYLFFSFHGIIVTLNVTKDLIVALPSFRILRKKEELTPTPLGALRFRNEFGTPVRFFFLKNAPGPGFEPGTFWLHASMTFVTFRLRSGLSLHHFTGASCKVSTHGLASLLGIGILQRSPN